MHGWLSLDILSFDVLMGKERSQKECVDGDYDDLNVHQWNTLKLKVVFIKKLKI
jgi:hypothetical protein